MSKVTLKALILRFKWRISLTFLLVILEALLGILYPLLIGLAINDLLEGRYDGIVHLGILGGGSLIIGSLRRFYDTRVYSRIYSQITPEMIERERQKGSPVSQISARSHLLIEFVEFLENSMPELVEAIIALIGIMIIIATLNLNVFYGCMGVLLLIFSVYAVSGKFHYRFNVNYNNELEKQVAIIEKETLPVIKNYYRSLMKWNIRLSDLETANYFVIWLGVIALFLYTPITVIESGVLEYGMVFSILMYVFDYIEKVVTFPLYLQQFIRLREISSRLMRE